MERPGLLLSVCTPGSEILQKTSAMTPSVILPSFEVLRLRHAEILFSRPMLQSVPRQRTSKNNRRLRLLLAVPLGALGHPRQQMQLGVGVDTFAPILMALRHLYYLLPLDRSLTRPRLNFQDQSL
jgi:hypothetical protein